MNAFARVASCAIALLALCCASCIGIERREFPKDWTPVAASAGACPDLTARYANSDQGSPSVPLAKWILPKTTYPLDRIERVYLTGPTNGSVTVRLVEGTGTEVAIRTLKEGAQYRCEDGWLVLSLESFVLPAPAVAYSEAARLARSRDGQLIVEATETGGGVIVFVPGYVSKRNWHMYPLAAE